MVNTMQGKAASADTRGCTDWTFHVIENADDALIIANIGATILHANPSTTRLFGYSVDELVGRPVELLMPERYHGSHAAHVADFAASSERARPMADRPWVQARRRSGETFPASVSILRLRHRGEILLGAFVRDMSGVAEQIEIEKRLRCEAEAAIRTKEAFLAHLSHELRTPLNAVIGFAEAMRDGHISDDPARNRNYAADIAASGQHLLRLLEQLLEVAEQGVGHAETPLSVPKRAAKWSG